MADEKPTDSEAAAPKKKGKMLMIILVLVLVLGGGAGAWFFLKAGHDEDSKDKEHAEASDEHEESEQPFRPRSKKAGEAPIFVELEPFIVNLQDKNQDRFAQIGVTFEVVDAEVTAELTAVQPAIRNAILMLISSKTSEQVLSVDGKIELANQIVDFANAIMAGEPLPHLKSFGTGASDVKEDSHGESHEPERDDQRKRRAKYIPERVLHTHFKQFIVQ